MGDPETSEEKQSQRDRDSYLRWQNTSITQLGYTINLMLTLAGATLGFAVKTMMKSKGVLPCPARLLFHGSVGLLAISILMAIGANVTRCLDFRYSRRAARARMEREIAVHNLYEKISNRLGRWTWRLFYVQASGFWIGVLAFALSIWLGFGYKI
jgi:hypothetical protein